MLTFGLNVNPNSKRPETAPTAQQIIAWGHRTGHAVKLSTATGELLQKSGSGVGGLDNVLSDKDLRDSIDVLISLGGDGTIITSARLVAGSDVSILGVNVGTLGFLTESSLADVDANLERIVAGDYHIDARMTLEMILEGVETPPALNEVVIDRGATSRIITIDLYSGERAIANYRADGLIIATPTGSTAYSLSVGGPILAPEMQAIVVSPISAFGFFSRPFVFADDMELIVRVYSNHGCSALTIDGQFTKELPESAEFVVRKGRSTVKLIRFKNSSFYKVIRQKLHWGRAPMVAPE